MTTKPYAQSTQDLVDAHKQLQTGMQFYASKPELLGDSSTVQYQHALRRAWKVLKLDGVLSVEGRPTLYLTIRKKRISGEEAADLQRLFWNQGLATIFVVVDSTEVRIFSGLAKPSQSVDEASPPCSLVETLSRADYALQMRSFLLELGTGSYFKKHRASFVPSDSVDAYLLNNLRTLRDKIVDDVENLSVEATHTFLARILFVSYLVDRQIIDLSTWSECQCESGTNVGKMLSSLSTVAEKHDALLAVFSRLKDDFNGSMFDEVTLTKCRKLNRTALDHLSNFLLGHDVGAGQYTLGFWAYDFSLVPVETISAVYEDFLKKEDQPEKRQKGAYYTPRFLAESVVDLALQDVKDVSSATFMDPACGSGIFLVTLFNRLASTWMINHPKAAYDRKASALKKILKDQLCGVDVNPTACRITCFSLYLAFLDRFSPIDIQEYIKRSGKLPSMLKYRDANKNTTLEFPVVFEADFLGCENEIPKNISVVVGNPPWAGRGAEKGLHHQFSEKIPEHLVDGGAGCLLLPSKMFLNDKTNAFQARWLRRVSVDHVVQLADYRRILFKEAICPGMIVRFNASEPDMAIARIPYVSPKVREIDLRDGVIPVAPADRKEIPLRNLLSAADQGTAPVVWKQYLWGTTCDLKFLDMLEQVPKLAELAGSPKENKRWMKGQGFQPDSNGKSPDPKKNPWPERTPFIKASKDFPTMLILDSDRTQIGGRFPVLHRIRDKRIYQGPLVLVSQGIGEEGLPKVAFSSESVLFQHSLQSISGPTEDEDLLMFLTIYLRSKLAKYFLFHSSANWGTERDKVLLTELMRMPFPLPGSEWVSPSAAKIVNKVAKKMRGLATELEGEASRPPDILIANNREEFRARKVAKLQAGFETLVYQYFGLIDQEIALVEDTVDVIIPSVTPTSLASSIPTTAGIQQNNVEGYTKGLQVYADTLVETLTNWSAQSTVVVSASGGIHEKTGMACVTVELTEQAVTYREQTLSDELMFRVAGLAESSTTEVGCLDYLRGTLVFDGPSIYIFKPVALVGWTRTAALNDAAEIYANIVNARTNAKKASP